MENPLILSQSAKSVKAGQAAWAAQTLVPEGCNRTSIMQIDESRT